MNESSPSPSLLVDAKTLASLLGIGRTLVFELHSSGRLGPRPIHLGRRVLWARKEVEAWVAAGSPPRAKWQPDHNVIKPTRNIK